MIIGGHDLNRQRLLIAEIGNNHEGDPQLALELVAAAAEAGVDAIKVQVIDPLRLVNRSQTERIAQLTRFRLPLAVLAQMAEAARARGVLFLASAFDTDSLTALAPLIAAVKIASGDLDFTPLLVCAAGLGKPILLSTGMATLAEVRTAVETIAAHRPAGDALAEQLVLLHCVSLYPAPLAEANLRAIATLREAFGLTVGYSDHTLGTEAAVAALALGARVIEKHFTLDKRRTTFRDHALSADPEDMARLAAAVHAYEAMLGGGAKEPSAAELEMAGAARRSIVAARDLPAGTQLSAADLDCVRPRNGMLPAAAASLIGRRLRAPLQRHDLVLESHLE
jgi:N-acetylneuraminate synthase/N,N'-diacetyllegionaminate synthase